MRRSYSNRCPKRGVSYPHFPSSEKVICEFCSLAVDGFLVFERENKAMDGGCCCGAVRYQIEGTPSRTTNCHCEHCRRTSGAPFVTWIEVELSKFTLVTGMPSRYESRPRVVRQFCASCGTQLTYQHEDEPDVLDVTACSLDTLEPVAPEDHIWCDRMAPWIVLADGLPRYNLGKFDK